MKRSVKRSVKKEMSRKTGQTIIAFPQLLNPKKFTNIFTFYKAKFSSAKFTYFIGNL